LPDIYHLKRFVVAYAGDDLVWLQRRAATSVGGKLLVLLDASVYTSNRLLRTPLSFLATPARLQVDYKAYLLACCWLQDFAFKMARRARDGVSIAPVRALMEARSHARIDVFALQ
jgi:hypothetical protein